MNIYNSIEVLKEIEKSFGNVNYISIIDNCIQVILKEKVNLDREFEITENNDLQIEIYNKHIKLTKLEIALRIKQIAYSYNFNYEQTVRFGYDIIYFIVNSDNKIGFNNLDLDYILYPNCEDKFSRVLPKELGNRIVNQAKEYLKEIELGTNTADKSVIEHWQKIANGILPYGYEIAI